MPHKWLDMKHGAIFFKISKNIVWHQYFAKKHHRTLRERILFRSMVEWLGSQNTDWLTSVDQKIICLPSELHANDLWIPKDDQCRPETIRKMPPLCHKKKYFLLFMLTICHPLKKCCMSPMLSKPAKRMMIHERAKFDLKSR